MTDNATSPRQQADTIMEKLNQTGLGKALTFSLVTHIVLLLLTSIPTILLCAKYGSTDLVAIKQQRSEERKAALEKEKEEEAAASKKEEAVKDSVASTDSVTPEVSETTPPDTDGPEKSPIEKELEKVDLNPPSDTMVSMDDEDLPY